MWLPDNVFECHLVIDAKMLLFAILSINLLPAVAGVDMILRNSTLLEGETLRIRCTEGVVGYLASLGVFTTDKQSPGSDPLLVVSYAFKRTISDFEQEWGTSLDLTRANATITILPFAANVFNVDFTMSNLTCADSAEFLCQTVTSQAPYTLKTQPQKITIQGETQYVQISGAVECDPVVDADCARCITFDNTTDKPKYARMYQEVLLRCTGLIGKPIAENTNPFSWYKKTSVDDRLQPINENVTWRVIGVDSPSSCTRQMTSELRYYPTNTDRELMIFCDVTRSGESTSVSANISICVSGLIPNTSPHLNGPENTKEPSSDKTTGKPTIASTECPMLDVERGILSVLEELLVVEKERLAVEKQRLALDKGKSISIP